MCYFFFFFFFAKFDTVFGHQHLHELRAQQALLYVTLKIVPKAIYLPLIFRCFLF